MHNFRNKVLALIEQIPRGKIATYGQIALLAGHPAAARQVGMILQGLKESNLPWHRVINSKGGISTYRVGFGELQQKLLEIEGVKFNDKGFCDLEMYQWHLERLVA